MTTTQRDELFRVVQERLSWGMVERLSDIVVVHLTPAQLVESMTLLRDDPFLDFKLMIDLAGVHYPRREKPFEVVYQLLSVYQNHRLRVKVALAEAEPLPSVIPVWSCANWYEREAYDMFGILFTGHPDLRRILMDYDFDGYPLRKDFPLVGHYEVRYDKGAKRVVREPIKLERRNNREYYAVGEA